MVEIALRVSNVIPDFDSLSYLSDGPYDFQVQLSVPDDGVYILPSASDQRNFAVSWFFSETDAQTCMKIKQYKTGLILSTKFVSLSSGWSYNIRVQCERDRSNTGCNIKRPHHSHWFVHGCDDPNRMFVNINRLPVRTGTARWWGLYLYNDK